MAKAFVTGWPIAHSRSPIIHNYWLKKHGIKGLYEIRESTVENFSSFLLAFQDEGFVGGNITLPHKEAAFDLVADKDPAAMAIGAVNTVWREGDTLRGLNSDAYGFLSNLDERAPGWDRVDQQKRGALVLGAGGASRAVIYGLLERDFEKIWIANRTLSRAENLARDFGPKCSAIQFDQTSPDIQNASVIVNCTSIGMGDERSPLDLQPFQRNTVVSDIVYAPLKTPLLEQAENLDMNPVDGLGMLLHQAVLGFEKWFGIRPEVTNELRDLVIADLGNTT